MFEKDEVFPGAFLRLTLLVVTLGDISVGGPGIRQGGVPVAFRSRSAAVAPNEVL